MFSLTDAIYLNNFSLNALGAASEGRVLQATKANAPSSVGFAFAGTAGLYDLSVDYFDENDGKAWTTLRVDGVDIGTWIWDKELGGALANAQTLTSRTFAGLKLGPNSVIELIGQANGGEPLRIDGLRFAPTPPAAMRIEAEAATLLENFRARALTDASGGVVLEASKTTAPSRAVFTFEGAAGRYDFALDYFDENDGKSWTTLRVDGVDIGTWIWDKELGGALANAQTLTSRSFFGLQLKHGSVVEVIGQADGVEPLRIDALRFEPTPEVRLASSASAGTAVSAVDASGQIEAQEAAMLENFHLRGHDDASDGALLQATDTGVLSKATFIYGGPAGRFDLSLDYFDENDGKAWSKLRVDGVDMGSWTWDKDLGSSYASAQTLTSKTFSGLDLRAGSVIELIGKGDAGEPLRIDGLRYEQTIHRGAPIKDAPAFAGAEGFGADAIGGRGGAVLHVTNLNDSGVGSLRWALEQSGPRIVVFDVEGRIELSRQITVKNPYLTLAGQTAPGEGIVVSGARINIESHDVIVRGMKMRVGDEAGDVPRNRDNISIGGNGDKGVRDVILDHNSFTWSVDENVSIWGTVRNVTISNNIIAEALNNSIHVDEGATKASAHSMGMIIGHRIGDPNSTDISIIKNLFASNMWRNAYIQGSEKVEFVNNLVVNYGAGHAGLALGDGVSKMSAAIIGNVYLDGQNTSNAKNPAFNLGGLTTGSTVLLKDNHVQGHLESATQAQTAAAHGKLSMVTDTFFFTPSGVATLKHGAVAQHVLSNAGARLHDGGLDVVDWRIVQGVIDKTAKVIDSTKQVGGFSVYDFTGAKVVDTDRDGMPDWFENIFARYGFNAKIADDKLDYDNDGFTNVEEYVNGMIDGFDFAWGGAKGALL